MDRSSDSSMDLLVGLLALQNGLIDQGQLVTAFQAWSRDRSTPLADQLVGRGYVSGDERRAVEALAALHANKHGSAEQSLGSLTADEPTRRMLQEIGDAHLTASVLQNSSKSTERDRASARTVANQPKVTDGGRFRVLRQHSQGGLGAVFVALDGELNREVALKQILDQHAHDPVSRQRFLQEAEITGGLEHPGIVPVYGLGTYQDGRPYYAMRFIRGDSMRDAIAVLHSKPVQDDAARRSLELRKLLHRFLEVCNAIDYAHGRGVLHRDLKPANVIVGKHGETLVVDWGLAKVIGRTDSAIDERTLAPAAASGSAETLPGATLGTPAFMSPEQARGDIDSLSPRSDVYSLGATLYCLLTGHAPFESDDVRSVLESVRKGAVVPPRRKAPDVDRDLEAICLKAMALQPADRYSTAKALADDIERWLADEPVSARREEWAERARRWSRRHKPIVTAGAALLITAGIAMAISLVLVGRQQRLTAMARDQKELARQKVRATLDAVASEAIDTLLAQQPQLTDQHRAFMRLTLEGYRQFAENPDDDRATRMEVADAHYRMARIRELLGESIEQSKALEVAISMYDRLAREQPDDPQPAIRLASCRISEGTRLSKERRDALAKDQFQQATVILRKLQTSHAGNPEIREQLSRALNGLGNVLADTRQNQPSLNAYEESRKLLEGLVEEFPDKPRYRAQLANIHYNLGILFSDLAQPDEGESQYKMSVGLYERIVEDQPQDAEMRLRLSSALINLGNHIADDEDRRDEGQALVQRGCDVQQQLVREYPVVPLYRLRLGRTYRSLADIHEQMQRPEEAEAMLRLALEIRVKLLEDFPGHPEYRRDLGSGHYQLGIFFFRNDAKQKAEQAFLDALAVQDPLVQEMNEVPDYAIEMTRTLGMLGYCAFQGDRLDEAENYFSRTRALQADLAQRFPTERQLRAELGLTYAMLASMHSKRGAHADALNWADRAVSHLDALRIEVPDYRTVQNYLATAHFQRSCALAQLQRRDEAVEALRMATDAGYDELQTLRTEPALEPLQEHPGYQRLLSELAASPGQ